VISEPRRGTLAIADTPRHVLVPTVYETQEQFYGSIANTRLNTAEHLELVYSVSTLVTAVVPNKYGSLVLLERKEDRLDGRFTERYGAFMVMRQRDNHDGPSLSWQPELPLDRERTTSTPAEPSAVAQFLRSMMSTTPLRHRYTFDEQTRQPTAVRLVAADGSCCEVALTPDRNGTRTVREGGPTPLWREIERAYRQWCDWGEPGWERVGITVRPEAWTVWLDESHNIIRWPAAGFRAR
jgi:hypothetical protein